MTAIGNLVSVSFIEVCMYVSICFLALGHLCRGLLLDGN